MQSTKVREPRASVRRNHGGFLLGASWSHDARWAPRRTHFYLGWWVLTVRTGY